MGAPPHTAADLLTPIERTPLYREVFDRLRDLVEHEDLSPGDRLPAERDLAIRLGVSRNSLRPALAALEALGVLEIRHGAGAFLKRTTLTEVADSFVDVLLEQNAELPAAMEARMGVERFVAGLAAGRRTNRDLARISKAIESMAGEIDGGRSGVRGDRAFHLAVAEASHNPVLLTLLKSIEPEVHRIREESLHQNARPQRSLAAHRRILKAIRDGDPRAAVAEMDAHLAEVADTPLVRRPGDRR